MSDEQEIKTIASMSVKELLAWVLSSPTDLTDSYYSKFRTAIHKRAQELGVWNE